MNLLSVNGLAKSFGDKKLFQDVSFGIESGQRAALVAKNGSGKSTMLRILKGLDIPDAGEFAFNQNIRHAFLEQEPEFVSGSNLREALFNSENRVLTAVREYETAMENLEEDPSESNQKALANAMEQMDEMEAWDLESKIKLILQKLNIGKLDQLVDTLSGGQKKRLAMARVLIDEPQLLIMDEPTNHLDLEMIEWLEAYFDRNDISLLLVTHDRHFLDHVCTDIYELDRFGIYRYQGNYEYFIEKKAEREANEDAAADKARNLYRKELEWVRRQPKARGTKSKSRLEAFEVLKDKSKKIQRGDKVGMDFQMSRLGGKILEIKHVNKTFGDLRILNDFSYTFRKGERIGIVGKNGAGKSTFLKLIMQELAPDSGELVLGETIVSGYYSQDGLDLPNDKRVIEVVRDAGDHIPMADGSVLTAVQLLQMFLFPPETQHGFVSKLSGGERKRLYLLTILMKNPNFLILDEPTNDLDLMTLSVLEDFLLNFKGCLILVTHDRYFMDKLVDQLLVFEGNAVIEGFVGTYTEYRELKSEAKERAKEEERAKEKEAKAEPIPVEAPPAVQTEPKRKLSFKEKFELEQLDKDIPALEALKAKLETEMTSVGSDHTRLLEITEQLAQVNNDLEEKELRWLELSE
ncbi:MAG: ABC transporter ATP-binding protein [Bacteroidetes bacterium]|nr:MAG: ABC transporter ATP-binding protein [Bacteroidota bacterium]